MVIRTRKGFECVGGIPLRPYESTRVPSPRRQALLDLLRSGVDVDHLALAALLVATEARHDLDIDACLRSLGSMGSRFRARLEQRDPSLRGRVEALNDILFEEDGFRGDTETYYDPRNSLLDQVLERRRGLPITLSIIFIAVGREGGLDVEGVGLPGHFIVRVHDPQREGEVLVDPFHRGQILSVDDCRRRVASVTGHPVEWQSAWLEAAAPHEVLVRLLNNLKRVYLRATNFREALWVHDLLVALQPDDLQHYRDRGLVNAQLQRYGDARRDLTAYLTRYPGEAPDAAEIEEDLERLRRLHHMLN